MLQRLLDELYLKQSRGTHKSVLSLFSNNHLDVTGINGANNWRNNYHIQKGFICYADSAELLNPSFHQEPRILCPHLRPIATRVLEGATCDLKRGAVYRREDHPKVLRMDPVQSGITIYDPSDVTFYRDIVAPNERRIPIAPLIVALYHNSKIASGRTAVDTRDFMLDFDFSAMEFSNYFNDDPGLVEHGALARRFPTFFTWSRVPIAAGQPSGPVTLVPGIPTPAQSRPRSTRTGPVPPPASSPSTIDPPAIGYWWHAEQAVIQLRRN